MRKAVFVKQEDKQQRQILQDAHATPQQRIERMFALIDGLIYLKKEYVLPKRENCVTLRRKHGIAPMVGCNT
jgi:threonine dehydratase